MMELLRNIKSSNFANELYLLFSNFIPGKLHKKFFQNNPEKIKMYSKNNICIIPTYRCNAKCHFCCAKDFYKIFPEDMTWDSFKAVTEYCLDNGINEISFLGGEPTVWPYINSAVSYLKKKGFQVSFFTNGITYSEFPPDCVLINIYNGFDENTRNKIRKTIGFYKDSGTEIILRYNLFSDSSETEDNKFFHFSLPLTKFVSISPAMPYVFSRELGDRIFRLVKKFHKRKIGVKIARAIPICLFSRNQYFYLRNKCLMRKKCYSKKNVVINPDGETLFSCVSMAGFEKNLFQDNFKKIHAEYKNFFKYLGSTFPFSECNGCKYAFNNECQAGCLAMRPVDTVENIINLVKGKNDR